MSRWNQRWDHFKPGPLWWARSSPDPNHDWGEVQHVTLWLISRPECWHKVDIFIHNVGESYSMVWYSWPMTFPIKEWIYHCRKSGTGFMANHRSIQGDQTLGALETVWTPWLVNAQLSENQAISQQDKGLPVTLTSTTRSNLSVWSFPSICPIHSPVSRIISAPAPGYGYLIQQTSKICGPKPCTLVFTQETSCLRMFISLEPSPYTIIHLWGYQLLQFLFRTLQHGARRNSEPTLQYEYQKYINSRKIWKAHVLAHKYVIVSDCYNYRYLIIVYSHDWLKTTTIFSDDSGLIPQNSPKFPEYSQRPCLYRALASGTGRSMRRAWLMESPRVEEETFMDTTNGLMEMNIHVYIYICMSVCTYVCLSVCN